MTAVPYEHGGKPDTPYGTRTAEGPGQKPGPFSRVQIPPDARARPLSFGYFNNTIFVESSKPSASIRQK